MNIEDVKKLLNHVTPGPWRHVAMESFSDMGSVIRAGDEILFRSDIGSSFDSEFVAKARELVPFLLDILDGRDELIDGMTKARIQLRARVAELEREAEQLRARVAELGLKDPGKKKR